MSSSADSGHHRKHAAPASPPAAPTPSPEQALTRRAALAVLASAGAAGLSAGCTAVSGNVGGRTGSSSPQITTSTAFTSAPATASPSRTGPRSLDALASALDGRLDLPGSAGWDPQRLLWNPRFATLPPPRAIARCASAQDVAACISYAAASQVPVAVRSGGHSYSGASTCEGLVVDLAASGQMSSVQLDPATGAAVIGAGALLVEVYAALATAGRSIGAGSCPSVGLSGLTLGGGVGVLARSYATTADQVVAIEAVDAAGRLRQLSGDSSERADRDLFWALRGGGAGSAVVTSWTLATRPAPTVWTADLEWPWSAAEQVLQAWQQWADTAPRELWSGLRLVCRQGGADRVVLVATWMGSAGGSALNGLLDQLTATSPSATSRTVKQRTYAEAMLDEAVCTGKSFQQCDEAAWSPSHRTPFAATSSIIASALPPAGARAAVQAVQETSAAAGVRTATMSFDVLGGAVADVPEEATPIPWRQALATVQHSATWSASHPGADPGPFDAAVAAQRAALRPWCGDAAYLNYADEQLQDRLGTCLQTNATRLRAVHSEQDPTGLLAWTAQK